MEFILEKLEVYNLAEKFSDDIWDLVNKRDYFNKDTIESNWCELMILFLQILPKGTEDIFIRKAGSSTFTAVALFRKQDPGYLNV